MANSIEVRLRDLINEFSDALAKEIIKSTDSLAAAGEWGVALEELCNMLFEYKIPILKSQYKFIDELGREMQMQENCWDFLRSLIKN